MCGDDLDRTQVKISCNEDIKETGNMNYLIRYEKILLVDLSPSRLTEQML